VAGCPQLGKVPGWCHSAHSPLGRRGTGSGVSASCWSHQPCAALAYRYAVLCYFNPFLDDTSVLGLCCA
jgi:hypothetical protein